METARYAMNKQSTAMRTGQRSRNGVYLQRAMSIRQRHALHGGLSLTRLRPQTSRIQLRCCFCNHRAMLT